MLQVWLVLCLVLLAVADNPKDLTWPMLAATKGQWKISFSLTSKPNKNEFVPHNCSSQSLNAPCNQPPMSRLNDDRIQVIYALKNASAPFKTFKDATPQDVAVLMCYAPLSFVDKPWRKLKKDIWKDKNCAYTIGGRKPFTANASAPTIVTMDFNSTSDLVSAAWYLKVVVFCQDGSKKGRICQLDETNSTSKNYFVTKKLDARSTGMVTAAVIMSCIGPIFFMVFYFLDARRRKNK